MFAAGLASMILFQLVVNVGMVMGVMPITGIPLPFVTHGGASLVSMAIALGIMQSINIRQTKRRVVTGSCAPRPIRPTAWLERPNRDRRADSPVDTVQRQLAHRAAARPRRRRPSLVVMRRAVGPTRRRG